MSNRAREGVIRRWLLAGAFAISTAAAPGVGFAATNIFLQLDGIPGESTDAKHKEQIDILSYSLGLTNLANTSSSSGAGASSGKLACGALVLTKFVDKSSPPLIAAIAGGKHIKSGKLSFTATGPKGGADYYVVSLTDLAVTAIQQSQASGSPKVTDQISFSVAKYAFEYQQVQPNGTLGQPQTAAVDCQAGSGR
ncbi:MAG: type VI secretion system tube protein Hcp [Burkholderiaceae bacterium]|nr:type VI secretion system tube protein Hcp [Burkholderiaceae bacterium]